MPALRGGDVFTFQETLLVLLLLALLRPFGGGRHGIAPVANATQRDAPGLYPQRCFERRRLTPGADSAAQEHRRERPASSEGTGCDQGRNDRPGPHQSVPPC